MTIYILTVANDEYKYIFHNWASLQINLADQDMTEIIFHIGMNKCASTTLQNDVFKYEPGSLGKFKYVDLTEDFGKQFQRLAPVGGRQFGDVNGVSGWLEKVKESFNNNELKLNRFIVSSESLCQSNKLSQRPIIPFLKSVNDDILTDGIVKIIIVFRNQADMLASDYAQNSGVIYKSSQTDFQDWALKRINGGGKIQLDWGGWSQDLIQTFGKHNVCILLLEEIQTVSFWENLVNFIDAKKLTADELHMNSISNKYNKRSIDEGKWRLAPFNLHNKAKIDVNKVYNFLWSSNKFRSSRKFLLEKSIEGRKKYLMLRGYQDGIQGDPQVTLDKKLRTKIQNHFEESNNKLSDILGKNVKTLGY